MASDDLLDMSVKEEYNHIFYICNDSDKLERMMQSMEFVDLMKSVFRLYDNFKKRCVSISEDLSIMKLLFWNTFLPKMLKNTGEHYKNT